MTARKKKKKKRPTLTIEWLRERAARFERLGGNIHHEWIRETSGGPKLPEYVDTDSWGRHRANPGTDPDEKAASLSLCDRYG